MSRSQLAALARWLRARGVDVSRVHFARTSSAGAGLVAAREVAAGGTLLALPLEACASAGAAAAWSPIALTSELPVALAGPLGALGRALAATDAAARLSDALAPGLRGGRAYNPAHAALLAAALLQQRGLGDAAHWADYVAALPSTLHTPSLWTSEQLARLAGSPVASAAAARASAVAAAHAALAPALAAAEVPAPLRTPAAFAWAHATVLARAFDVPSMGLLALAPGLDLCNHGGGAGGGEHVATVALEGGGGAYAAATCAGRAGAQPPALVLRAGAAGALEGDGVLHRYAGDAAGESLLEFGFANGLRDFEDTGCAAASKQENPPAPAVVLLDLSTLLLAAPAAADVALAPPAARLAALHAAGLCGAPLRAFEASSVGVAALSGAASAADAAAGELMLPRRALAATRALVASADELVAAASARNSSLRLPVSPPAEARAAAALLDVVRTAQRGYTTQQPPPPRGGGDDARRARLADVVLHGELRVLQALEAALELRRARALAGACMRENDDDGDADTVALLS